MDYRINRRTGDKISVLGLGASSVAQGGQSEDSRRFMTTE